MKILKITLFISMLCSFTMNAQHQLIISQETYNSDGCVTSANLEYTIPEDADRRYQIIIYDRDNYLTGYKHLGSLNPGTYSYGTILNPYSSTIILEGYSVFGFRVRASTTLVRCENDRDSDGILNDDDNCPDSYSTTQNYGCPGIPDYVMNGDTEMAAPGWGSYNLNYARTSNNPIYLSRFDDGYINITKLLLDNLGNGDGQRSIKINFYISNDENVSSDDFKFSTYASHSEKLVAGGTTTYSSAPSIKLYGSSVGDKLSYGWYNLIIALDEDDVLNSGTVDNTYTIPLEYVNSWVGKPSTKISKEKSLLDLNQSNVELSQISQSDLKMYDFNIYDFTGNLIKSIKINSIQQENDIISRLSTGLYILKTPFEVRKISK